MQLSQLPLTALRAFEAAARHLSFKAAAAELHVTPTAVSHQIQQLESMLGLALFVRVHRGLTLTPAAHACLQPLREGFASLAQAMEALSQFRESGALSVSAPPSFTLRLLMPITHQFLALHPEVDLNVTTRMREPGLSARAAQEEGSVLRSWAESADVVIVYGSRPAVELEVRELMPLSVTLLCSPGLLRGEPRLRTPADVFAFPWLHDERGAKYGGASYWQQWLAKAGLTPAADRGSRFTHAAPAIEAAVRGEGLVVTTPALCQAELARGTLVAPFDIDVRLQASYWILARPGAAPRVQAFAQWLAGSLAADRATQRAGADGITATD